MSYHTDTSDPVEQSVITTRDGEPFARLTYFDPTATPQHRYETWVVDFANGDRLTGEPAVEVAKRLMDSPGTEPCGPTEFDTQADTLLDTVVYDDDSRNWRITVRGVRVWFGHADDSGDDVVLYAGRERDTRAGVIEDAPFDADELMTTAKLARRQTKRHA